MDMTFDNIASVYSGKAGACCCGCAGSHTQASTSKEKPQPSRIADAKVKRTWDKVFGGKNGDPKLLDGCAYVEVGRRMHVVYFNN